MSVLHPLACLGLVLGFWRWSRRRWRPRGCAVAGWRWRPAALGAAAWAVAPVGWVGLHLAEQKGLARALAIQDARGTGRGLGPAGAADGGREPDDPLPPCAGPEPWLRPPCPPAQLGVFADGEFAAGHRPVGRRARGDRLSRLVDRRAGLSPGRTLARGAGAGGGRCAPGAAGDRCTERGRSTRSRATRTCWGW